MKEKKATRLARRAWHIVRLALLWARKGGAFRRKLMLELRHVPAAFKHLKIPGKHSSNRIHYGEREFSFDDTPSFRFKIHRTGSTRPSFFQCVNPTTSFDEDDDGDEYLFDYEHESEENVGESEGCSNGGDSEEGEEEEEGIDAKAEVFISKFYEQMKLQRQVSLLQYNEMLHRSIS